MKCLVVGCKKDATDEIVAKAHEAVVRGYFCKEHYKLFRDCDGFKLTGRELKRVP